MLVGAARRVFRMTCVARVAVQIAAVRDAPDVPSLGKALLELEVLIYTPQQRERVDARCVVACGWPLRRMGGACHVC